MANQTAKRPAFERMLENIWAGNFPQVLSAKDASRISRGAARAAWHAEKKMGVNLEVYVFDMTGEGKRRKRVPTGADTRLITPYTSYLLRGFQR